MTETTDRKTSVPGSKSRIWFEDPESGKGCRAIGRLRADRSISHLRKPAISPQLLQLLDFLEKHVEFINPVNLNC
jgi:hypothetical protein